MSAGWARCFLWWVFTGFLFPTRGHTPRDAARETETLNLDRRMHVLAIFAEIAAAGGGR